MPFRSSNVVHGKNCLVCEKFAVIIKTFQEKNLKLRNFTRLKIVWDSSLKQPRVKRAPYPLRHRRLACKTLKFISLLIVTGLIIKERGKYFFLSDEYPLAMLYLRNIKHFPC